MSFCMSCFCSGHIYKRSANDLFLSPCLFYSCFDSLRAFIHLRSGLSSSASPSSPDNLKRSLKLLLYCCNSSLYCLLAGVAFCCAGFFGFMLIKGYFFSSTSCSSIKTISSINWRAFASLSLPVLFMISFNSSVLFIYKLTSKTHSTGSVESRKNFPIYPT